MSHQIQSVPRLATKNRLRAIFPAVLPIILPLIVFAHWHWSDQAYPRSDAAEYFMKVQYEYLVLMKEGIWNYVNEFYGTRLWKPTLITPFVLPWLYISQGNVVFSVRMTLLVWYSLFCLYLFLYLRIYLKTTRLWVAYNCVALSPIPLIASHEFRAELAFITVTLGAIYHLVRSEKFSNSTHVWSSGLLTSLALCIRPVESLLYLGPIGLAAAWGALQRPRERILVTGLLGFALGLGALNFVFPDEIWPFYLLILVSISGMWLVKKRKQIQNIALCLSIALILAGAWFLNSRSALLTWISSSSFEAFVQQTGHRKQSEFIQFFLHIFRVTVGPPLLIASVMVLIAAKKGFKNLWDACTQNTLSIASLVTALLIPLFVGAFTANGDCRYYFMSGVIATIVASLIVFSDLPVNPKVRWTLSFLLILASTLTALDLSGALLRWSPPLSRFSELLRGHELDLGWIVERPDGQECEEQGTLRLLLPLFKPNKEIRVATIDLVGDSLPAIEPFRLEIISREKGLPFTFTYPWGPALPLESRFNRLSRTFDWLVIGPLDGKGDNIYDHFSDAGAELVKAWKNGTLDPVRFKSAVVLSPVGNARISLLVLRTSRSSD